jgi:predicted alpha/beta hydrolase family esterase
MDVKYWLQDRYVKPFGTIDMPGYLAVLDDPQWALFVAGQVEHSHGCIVAGCLGCARKALVSSVAQGNIDGVMLIGYM